MIRTISWSIVFIGAMFIISSCDDTTAHSYSDIEKIVFPEANIDYYATIQPLFNIGCATEGCHNSGTKASDLDLTSYESLMLRSYDVVIKKDTVASRLIWYIDGKVITPQPHRPLNSNQVRGFKKWIMEGATDTVKTK